MTPEEALRQSLVNLALRVTTSRGGYVGGGQPHAAIPSDPGAIEQLAQSLAARLPAALPVPALDALRLALIDLIKHAEFMSGTGVAPLALSIERARAALREGETP